ELGTAQLGRTGAAAVHHVGDAQAVPEELVLLIGPELARGEAGTVQRGPEPVAGAGEVVTGPGRVQAGVDAAEQHVQAGGDDVRDTAAGRGGEAGRRWPGGHSGRRGPAARCAASHDSTSSAARGRRADSTRAPSPVTST